MTDEQDRKIKNALAAAGLEASAIHAAAAGSDFWEVELVDGSVVQGWPCDGVDGFRHLLQQIAATNSTRRRTSAIFGIKRGI